MDAPLRLAEFIATLALAQDNAFGQPLESQLRSCLLASWICDEAGVEPEVRDDAYWVALLRYVGYIVSGIAIGLGFLWIIWDDKKQGWHDKIASTKVIRVR